MAHIVHVCPRYFPARGGVELFFTKLSEALARDGHDVTVWTTDASTVRGFTSSSERRMPPGPQRVNSVEVRRFPVRYVPAQRFVRTAAHCLPFGMRWKCDTLRWTPWVPALTGAATRPSAAVDVVHATALPYSSILFAGARLAARTGARLIVSPFTHIAPPGPRGARMRRAYLSPLNLRLLSRADCLFVQTELESRTLSEAGISSERHRIVGLGVDRAECGGGDRARARRTWGVGNDDVVVGHLANKSWDKGTVDLLDAAEALWEKGASFSLVLAGSEMPTFTTRWASVRFRDHVVNLGELSDAERRDFFAAIDVFALPSYVESFGVSSLEAALTGAAIVAYDHGGPSQIFHHGVDALLVPVGDVHLLAESLRALTADTAERARLAAAGSRTASTYSWTRALDAALADYDALLRLPRGA
jgi:glycosyltransferase involved in cell wall biosynthesis